MALHITGGRVLLDDLANVDVATDGALISTLDSPATAGALRLDEIGRAHV